MELLARDSLKINMLRQLTGVGPGAGSGAEMGLFLESENAERPYSEIREGQGRAFRYNNFDVQEDEAEGTVTFTPRVAGCLAVFRLVPPPGGGFKIEIIRRSAAAPERVLPLAPGENRLALSPIDTKRYSLVFRNKETAPPRPPSGAAGTPDALLTENAAARGDIAILERRTAELTAERAALGEKIAVLADKLAWLEAGMKNGGDGELAELGNTLGIDGEILSFYLDEPESEDTMKLLGDVRAGVAKLEDRIREYAARRERKTAEIERSLMAGTGKA